MHNCGIYKIENIINKDCYIGRSKNLKQRLNKHLRLLKKNKHFNFYLQNAVNKYDIKNFILKVIVYCEEKDLHYYEQNLVNKLKPKYNICLECVDNISGYKFSEEAKIKMSESRKGEKSLTFGKKRDKDICQKITKGKLGKKISKKTTSKYVGVSFHKNTNLWVSHISYNKRSIHLGYFNTEFEAAISYNSAAISLYGYEAKLNVIENANKYVLNELYMYKNNKNIYNEKLSISILGEKRRKNCTSIYVGVYYIKDRKKWTAKISYCNKKFYLGRFSNEIEAAMAYNKKAIELFGENAKLNIIEIKEE